MCIFRGMADIRFKCSGCDQVLEAPEDMAGVEIACPSCNANLTIPVPSAPEKQAPVADVQSPLARAIDEAVSADEAGTKCPSCGEKMESGSVLCLGCGFHTKLGKKISTELM